MTNFGLVVTILKAKQALFCFQSTKSVCTISNYNIELIANVMCNDCPHNEEGKSQEKLMIVIIKLMTLLTMS